MLPKWAQEKYILSLQAIRIAKLDLLKTIWVCLHIHAYMDQ